MKQIVLTLLLVQTTLIRPTQTALTVAEEDGLLNAINVIDFTQIDAQERMRNEGNSGLSNIRNMKDGTQPYYSPGYSAWRFGAFHNHDNNFDTVGLGEMRVVLNGVQFGTRHNDFSLRKPVTNDNTLHKTEQVTFPDVPPAVTGTVAQQVAEMKEWFKAFKNQDTSTRDYRPYFKPVLCYLEGAWFWTNASVPLDTEDSSDRHATYGDWEENFEKFLYSAESGRKQDQENVPYLPIKIADVDGVDGVELAVWNYRVLCHELQDDLPLNRLRPRNDLQSRLRFGQTWDEYLESGVGHFQVKYNDDQFNFDGMHDRGLLDELMEQIPGKDNYGASLVDNAYGRTAKSLKPGSLGTNLNTGHYSRWFDTQNTGAMGVKTRNRGFFDATLYAAMTSNTKVVPTIAELCQDSADPNTCQTYEQRWTYAIPVEIIYLTPLTKWNPHNIEHKGDPLSTAGLTVTAGGRNGDINDATKAYNGTNDKKYFRTPYEFFVPQSASIDPADTSAVDKKGVLNINGDICLVTNSGHNILFPEIQDIGIVRQRYPIMPVSTDNNVIHKELAALKDIVVNPVKNRFMYDQGHHDGSRKNEFIYVLRANGNTSPQHAHLLRLSAAQVIDLHNGKRLTVNFEEALTGSDRHSHLADIEMQMRMPWYQGNVWIRYLGNHHPHNWILGTSHWCKASQDTDCVGLY